MANELRKYQNFIGGLIEDNPLTNVATTLTSAGLAAIVGGVASTEHMAIVLDPDGLAGAPEVAWITANTAGVGTATIARGKEGTTAREHARDIPWVHTPLVNDVHPLLAAVNVRPADSTISTTSTTLHDLDDDITGGVVAQVTYLAPPSGCVDILMQAMVGNSGNYYQVWGLRDSGGDVANTIGRVTYGSIFNRVSYLCHIEGLTPGTSYTHKWAWKTESAGTVNMYVGTTFGPLVMQAYVSRKV